MALHQNAFTHQMLDGLPDGHARHVHPCGQIAFGGKRIARFDGSAADGIFNAALQLQV
jgi:hypothetical protein